MFPDDDIRETIINYADGAGEENTVFLNLASLCLIQLFFLFGFKLTDFIFAIQENFNIGVIKKPIGPIIQTTTVVGGQASGTRTDKQPLEVHSNDQNMIYAYEGEGSEVGSLSSLVSNRSDRDQEYEYIKEWGPKFYKLSNIFINDPDSNIVINYQNNFAFDYNADDKRKQDYYN